MTKAAGNAGNLRQRPVDVAAGLVFREGKLLITQRSAGTHLGGFWEFPGGKREFGETFAQCLRRELREELGIEVRVGKLIADIFHDYPERSVRIKFFRCAWLQNEPKPFHCEELAWITIKQLSDYAFPAADERILGVLRRKPGIWSL